MKDKIKITSDGTPRGTKITFAGKEIPAISLRYAIDADSPGTVELTVWGMDCELDLEAQKEQAVFLLR